MGISKIPNNLQIVEEGSGNDWRWKKYSDGTAECWGYHSFSIPSTGWHTWGNLYYSDELGGNAFPSGLFIERPYCVMTPNLVGSDGWLSGGRQLSKTILYKFYIMRPNAYSGTLNFNLSVHAYGRWK